MAKFLIILTLLVFTIKIKNCVTLKMRNIITDAIYVYHIQQISINKTQFEVEYDDAESYEKTLFRIWDWGYKHILPPDKFEIIKPFIGKGELTCQDKKE